MNKISSGLKRNSVVAILMSVRDEQSYIDLNISYHLDLGFDYIFIANHCSTDNTSKVLDTYNDDPRIIVLEEKNPIFDHAKISNRLLKFANSNYLIDWFVFLDADEFLALREMDIHKFVDCLEKKNIPYATIGWANALFDHSGLDYRCAPVHPIDTTKFFYPWPERKWQEFGHFRKAIVKNHKNIEVAVGGHYVKTGNNLEFFGEFHWNPFVVPKLEAKLLHFEFRENASALYKKWEKLALFEHDSTSDESAPWLERIRTIREYVLNYKDNIDALSRHWFSEHRTFWGTLIPNERIEYDITLSIWFRKYFKKKIESGKIKSVCLVRKGNLGDVLMTEPVARFLSKFVDRIYLATDQENARKVINSYDGFFQYNAAISGKIDCEIIIKLVYEFSNNRTSYINGYMESIGFGGMATSDIPKLNDDWVPLISGDYILLAPHTSEWQEQKRKWAFENFKELAAKLEDTYGIKCVMLEKSHTFGEMMALIKYCKLFVGNDSAPAIIAQSFNKKSFIIFGATRPEYLHLLDKTVPIYDKNRHSLCNHISRSGELECCEEFCMDRIRVEMVLGQIKRFL